MGLRKGLVAIPGLLGENESTRCDEFILYAESQGIKGTRFNYCTSRVEGKKIYCIPDLSAPLSDCINQFISAESLDSIALLSTSAGAMLAAEYLANTPSQKLKATIWISPLLGWSQFLTPYLRTGIIASKADIPCSSQKDKDQGFERVIPADIVPKISQVDTLSKIERNPPRGLEVLTILGRKDTIVNLDSIRNLHKLLGGNPNYLIELAEEHSVPSSFIYVQEAIKRFGES